MGRGDFYIYGWTHRKKKNNKRKREGTQKKKERKNDVTREIYTHIDAFCVFLLFFKYHFNTQTYARATPTPAKTKTQKTSDVAALNENLRKERIQIYLAFILRRFLVNIFLLIIA